MTARAAVPQSTITRAIRAAYKAGSSVVEVRPDGSVVAYKAGEIALPKVDPPSDAATKWSDPR